MTPVADTKLADQYGVPVSIITQHRETVLKEGVDWQRDGKRILWLASGLAAIASMVDAWHLGPEKKEGGAGEAAEASGASGDPGEGEDSGAGAEAAPEAPRRATARILSKYPNPIWVRAHISGEKDGRAFDVRVRSSLRLAKNSLLPVELLPCGTWICVHPQHSPKPFA